jgi:hypothetical protein
LALDLASVAVARAARVRALLATVALRLAVVAWALERSAAERGVERVVAGLRVVAARLRGVADDAGEAVLVDAICGTPQIED